ncbi:MAG: hypothetical protein H8E12_06235 [Rhodobacteraceae bacterium]|nr:hypothetical protein [Paracoccaceae bacterium]
MEDLKFKISKSTQEVYSKAGGAPVVKFETLEVTPEELSSIVRRYNYSMSRWHSGQKVAGRFIADPSQTNIGHCSNESFAEMYGVILDVDENLTLESAKELFAEYKGVIFTSTSHQVPKKTGSGIADPCDRFRVFLPFHSDEYIADKDMARSISKAALEKWNFADQSCFDPARKYYPTTELEGMPNRFEFYLLEGENYLAVKELAKHIRLGNPLDSEVEDKKITKALHLHNSKVPTFALEDKVQDENKAWISIQTLLDKEKEENIFCMFCDDINSESRSAVFYPENWRGVPALFCQHCKSVGDGYNTNGIYYLNNDDAYKIISERTGNIAFIDKNTNKLFFGAYDKFKDEYHIDQKDFTTIKNTLKEQGMPTPSVFAEVRYELVPDSDQIVDLDAGFINYYVAPKLLKAKGDQKKAAVPNYIGKILSHMIPDTMMREHFLNWLSWIVQTRSKARTTFLLQGVQGIGKNLFYDLVIKELFGVHYCTDVHQNKFLSRFNAFMTTNVWVLVNEVSIDFSTKDELAAKLKPFITDAWVEAESKGIDSRPTRNYCNTLFFSNKRSSVYLEASDRRFNVCDYVEKPIYKTDWWPGLKIESLVKGEIETFAHYLKTRDIDVDKAMMTLDNAAKQELITISKTNAELFFDAMKTADYDWFEDSLVNDSAYGAPSMMELSEIILAMRANKRVFRSDLTKLFSNICQKKQTPTVFSRQCTIQGIAIKTIRIQTDTGKGFIF